MKELVEIRADTAVTNASAPVRRGSSALAWLGLLCILALYVTSMARLHPTNFFGFTHDDSIYFSSAKALAEGKGYILPSVPGTPPATKYPILYPWLLSWVWRWQPSFPANLSAAVTVNVIFGCLFLTMAYSFLRQVKGLSDASALALTAFCAVHPLILVYSADLMTDVPFAALSLGSIVLANRTVEEDAGFMSLASGGILSGLAILMRVLGVPIAAGLFVAIALRSSWRKAITFAACVAPFLLGFAWRALSVISGKAAATTSSCAHSWQMTWLYYTTYSGFWVADTIHNHTFWATLKSNLLGTLLQPGSYIIQSQFVSPGMLAITLLAILSGVVVLGIIRQVKLGGWQPAHVALIFYLLPVLIWDFGARDRFLIPFLPLFAASLWVEAKQLLGQIRVSLQKKDSTEEKIAAWFFCLAGVAALLVAGLSWWRTLDSVRWASKQRGDLIMEKREAYDWMRENTPPTAKFIAYEDVTAFLYSARQGMRPTTFLPAGVYRPEVLSSNLACITSSADPLGATYWVVSDDDFGFEWEPATLRARAKEAEMESSLPSLFRSHQGHVRIYGLDPSGN